MTKLEQNCIPDARINCGGAGATIEESGSDKEDAVGDNRDCAGWKRYVSTKRYYINKLLIELSMFHMFLVKQKR